MDRVPGRAAPTGKLESRVTRRHVDGVIAPPPEDQSGCAGGYGGFKVDPGRDDIVAIAPGQEEGCCYVSLAFNEALRDETRLKRIVALPAQLHREHMERRHWLRRNIGRQGIV